MLLEHYSGDSEQPANCADINQPTRELMHFELAYILFENYVQNDAGIIAKNRIEM